MPIRTKSLDEDLILKHNFIRLIAQDAGFTIRDTYTFFNSFLRVIARCLIAGKTINIASFGKFYVADIPAYESWDNINKKTFWRDASKRIVFKISSTLKNTLNEYLDEMEELELMEEE